MENGLKVLLIHKPTAYGEKVPAAASMVVEAGFFHEPRQGSLIHIDNGVIFVTVLYGFKVYVTGLWIPELEICQASLIFANIYFLWGQKNIQMRIILKIMSVDLEVIIMLPLTKISLDTT